MDEDRWLPADDERLAQGCVRGDPAAFRVFLHRHRPCLAEGLESAVRRDGDLGVGLEDLGRRSALTVAQRWLAWPGGPETRPGLGGFLRRLEMEDLVLAMACARGSDRAWRLFDRRHRGFIRASAARFARRRGDVAEIVEGFYADLYLPRPGGANPISRFQGRSKLRTWLRTVLYFKVKDHYGRGRVGLAASVADPCKRIWAPGGIPLQGMCAPSLPPAEACEARDLRARVRDSLGRSFAALTQGERDLLREYYVRRRTVIQIGNDCGVHKASVSRWLKRLRGKLLRELERNLGAEFPRTAEEVGQLLACLEEGSAESSIMGA